MAPGVRVHQAAITATQLTAKLRDPRAGERPFRRDCLSSKLDLRPDNLGVPQSSCQQGAGFAHWGLETSSQRGGRKLLQAQDCWTDAQEAAPSESPAPQSVVRGEDPGGSRGSRDGGLKARLRRLDQQKECPPHPSDEIQL